MPPSRWSGAATKNERRRFLGFMSPSGSVSIQNGAENENFCTSALWITFVDKSVEIVEERGNKPLSIVENSVDCVYKSGAFVILVTQ